MAEEKKKVGRPPVELDEHKFETMMEHGYTCEEIAARFSRDMHLPTLNADTVSRWCKRTYGVNFKDFSDKRRRVRDGHLRELLLKQAETNPSVLIFCAKNWLGMRDNPDEVKAPAEPIRIVIEKAEGGNAGD